LPGIEGGKNHCELHERYLTVSHSAKVAMLYRHIIFIPGLPPHRSEKEAFLDNPGIAGLATHTQFNYNVSPIPQLVEGQHA